MPSLEDPRGPHAPALREYLVARQRDAAAKRHVNIIADAFGPANEPCVHGALPQFDAAAAAGFGGFDEQEYTPPVTIRNANRHAILACRYAPRA